MSSGDGAVTMNLSSVIAHHAERDFDAVALSMLDATRTYGELLRRTRLIAGTLRERGVEPGSVVAVLLHNSIEFVELMCATAHVGGIFMPLNWRLAPAEIAYICGHAEASIVVSEPELHHLVDDAGHETRFGAYVTTGASEGQWLSLENLVDSATAIDMASSVGQDDIHRLMYTSGTTSRPKGVMITYGNLFWKCAGQVVEQQLTRHDRGLIAGPLYHVGALDLTLTNLLYVGASAHIIRRFDPGAVLAAIDERRITNIWLAPAMVNAIASSPEASGYDLSSVKVIVDGGEKMPLPLIDRVLELFPNAWFADAYGLTETVSGDTFLDKGSVRQKLGSVGKPVLHTEVRVVNDDGKLASPGVHGEVVIRGPKVCKGYWRDPDATAAAFRDGWFHTGDIGYLDEDGYLFIVDRLKDVIISGGENIASLEVERVLYEHSAVAEVAVVARPDARWNEVPVAYVVTKPGANVNDAELTAFCVERLAKFKVPKAFRFIEALPRNPSGKVLKRYLREKEAQQASATVVVRDA